MPVFVAHCTLGQNYILVASEFLTEYVGRPWVRLDEGNASEPCGSVNVNFFSVVRPHVDDTKRSYVSSECAEEGMDGVQMIVGDNAQTRHA